MDKHHTNKNCHVKQICRCYKFCEELETKEEKEEPKICKFCSCIVGICTCKDEKSKSPKEIICTCCTTNKSSDRDRELCKICCRLLKNCICNKKKTEKKAEKPSTAFRPRTLWEDLPLYDEKSHLLGYIKKGAVIDEPFCDKSKDKVLEKSSSDTEDQLRLNCEALERACMASCRYAEGVRRDNVDATSVPRWTTKSAYDYATKRIYTSTRPKSKSPSPAPTRQVQTKRKTRKKDTKVCVCPCD